MMWTSLHSQSKWLTGVLNQFFSIVLLIGLTIDPSSGSCVFEGLIAACHKDVGGIPLQISARINHCHSPLDISFLIKSPRHYRSGDRSEPLYWEYTYVTTNEQESREIPGFDHRILFLLQAEEVLLKNETGRESFVSVEAYFKIEDANQTRMDFLRQNVTIYRFDDCFYAERDSHIAKVAIGMSVSVMLLVVSGVAAYLYIRNRRLQRQLLDEEKQDLVKNMAPQSKRKRKSKKSNMNKSSPSESIKYVVPSEGSKNEVHELEIYVSTSTGLERVQFPQSKNKETTNSAESDVQP